MVAQEVFVQRTLKRLQTKRTVVDCPTMGTPCWVWSGERHNFGYGVLCHAGNSHTYAHRIAYELLVGPIPEGLQLDHLCRNPPCFNPAHLEPVTSRENTMRGENWSAKKAAQTHCVHGHEFTEANTRIRANGTRKCKKCEYDNCKRYYRERRAKSARSPLPSDGD